MLFHLSDFTSVAFFISSFFSTTGVCATAVEASIVVAIPIFIVIDFIIQPLKIIINM
ncbi:hypothetical protein MNB_SV-12-1983 [hydrothermal vent metagenome]|uniref:Uncharacterized protein n=1 Tax=hydrothermal vent metagenome TaxID=652676 RepID=A0A1W1BVS7_9ZZZZ